MSQQAPRPQLFENRPLQVVRADPLLEALIDKLPSAGSAWPIEQRLVWLRMAAMAFDLAYGIEAPTEIKLVGVPMVMAADDRAPSAAAPAAAAPAAEQSLDVGPRLGKKREADQKYVVDLDGLAWGPRGLITPDVLGNGDIIWDFRPGEPALGSIVWADGEQREPHQLPPLQVFRG